MFEKDAILVATRRQKYSCGATKLHEGAIVKAANYEDESSGTIIVYLSKRREGHGDYLRIDSDRKGLRLATEAEADLWAAGVRNCNGASV